MHFLEALSGALLRIAPLILKDMAQPLSYLPLGAAVGAFVFCLLLIVRHFTKFSLSRKQSLMSALCAVYLVVALQTAFFSREPGSRTSIDLALFATWGESPQAHAYVIENIIMFLPFGILFPAAFAPLRRAPLCVLFGFLFSCSLELMQLITERGHCQLDDIVTNTLGTLLGWIVFTLIDLCARQLFCRDAS